GSGRADAAAAPGSRHAEGALGIGAGGGCAATEPGHLGGPRSYADCPAAREAAQGDDGAADRGCWWRAGAACRCSSRSGCSCRSGRE
ncbi:unnamed protein product, partial [Effrenium voratum]